MSETRRRRGYLDWMRGLAVLVMIEAHVLDSWTRVDARHSPQFMWAMIVGGFGAPLFLFLAGVSVSLSAGSKLRRCGSTWASARPVMMRGLWVFGLAFAFRLQAWILGFGPPRSLLKVDILNIMGPAIIGAAALWGAFRTSRSRAVALGAAALAIALLAPIVRHTPMLDSWPDALASYLRPTAGRSNFCIFPWVGFVFAGGVAGVLIDGAQTRAREATLNSHLFGCGLALAVVAYASSYLPTPYTRSEFWGASPAYFFVRTGVITALIAVAYGWGARHVFQTWSGWSPSPAVNRVEPWSPMQQLGRSSLFIYWIHVEMVYGLISVPLHKGLSETAVWGALGALTVFLLGCAIAKDRVVAWRSGRQTTRAAPLYVAQ
jgi:uncharacterized membrane protein